MDYRRKSPRIAVDLPIVCHLTGRHPTKTFSSAGRVRDLSVCGMRVEVPVPLRALGSAGVDYDLPLPAPFRAVTGNGRIRWAAWNEAANHTVFGMEIIWLDQADHEAMELILAELAEEHRLSRPC